MQTIFENQFDQTKLPDYSHQYSLLIFKHGVQS